MLKWSLGHRLLPREPHVVHQLLKSKCQNRDRSNDVVMTTSQPVRNVPGKQHEAHKPGSLAKCGSPDPSHYCLNVEHSASTFHTICREEHQQMPGQSGGSTSGLSWLRRGSPGLAPSAVHLHAATTAPSRSVASTPSPVAKP